MSDTEPERDREVGKVGSRPMDPDRPCRNCGDTTPGEYCPTCGQRKADIRVSVRTLLVDVLEDQFILDKRLPRTLGALLFRPGRLTVDYVEGRMARHIHPFRLYLVSSLLFFLLLSFFSLRLVRRTSDDGTAELPVATDSLRQELVTLDSVLVELDFQEADTTLPAAVRGTLAATRSGLTARRAALLERLDSVPPERGAAESGPQDSATTEPAVTGVTVDEDEGVQISFGSDGNLPGTGIAVLDSTLSRRARRLEGMEPREAVEALVGTFFNYVPTLMFILLPIFALVLKLLYVRRGRYYAEHFVFLLHAHSFVFLLSAVGLVLRAVPGVWVELVTVGWGLTYIYLAMRRVYGQGRGKTLLKYWILGWTYFFILAAAIPVLLVASVLLF